MGQLAITGSKTASVAALTLTAGMWWAPAPAHAYRTFADDPGVGVAAAQQSSTVEWDLTAVDPDDPELAVFEEAAVAAFETWTSVSCASVRASYAGRASQPGIPGDHRNTIQLVRSGWLARGLPGGRGASTDVELRELGGRAEIVEADIYVNLEEFRFGTEADPSALDPQGVLTHEIGHLLGLLHPCEDDQPPVPQCASDPAFSSSALFPTYSGPQARLLAPDDRAAVCALYPVEGCPLSCPVAYECAVDRCVPCATPDCAAPTCPPDGCPPVPCEPDGTCVSGECALYGEHLDECVQAGDLGTRCTTGTACTSGTCLVRSGTGHCTARCQSDSECAGLQRCTQVEGIEVCAPLPSQAACSIDAGASHPNSYMVWLAAVGLLLVRVSRRARMTPKGNRR